MNSEKLARATFVLDRATFEQLDYISRRMNVSRSELVRDTLAEPIALMAKWVQSVPDEPTPADVDAARHTVQLDLVELITRKSAEVAKARSS